MLSLRTASSRLYRNSPWSPAFPPAPPPLVNQFCSAPSSVLRRCLTSQQRTRQVYGHRPFLTDPPACLPTGTAEISRFSNIECPRMLRFFDSAGPISGSLRLSPPSSCCLPHRSTRSAPRMGDFGALCLACVFPCRTLHVQPRGCPRMTWGRDGAATPFTWGSFIPYSNAGLSRRFQNVPSLPQGRRPGWVISEL